MITPELREIDGITFQFSPLTYKQARDLFSDLLQNFGPSAAAVFEGIKVGRDLSLDDGINDINLADAASMISGSIGGGIREFSRALTPHLHKKMVDLMAARTTYKKDGEDFRKLNDEGLQILFATNMLTEFKWLLFCLEVQYADFFDWLKKAKKIINDWKKTAQESKSKSQTE